MNQALIQQLQQWFASEIGQTVLGYEKAQAEPFIKNAFGYVALQIGMPSIDFLAHNRMLSKLILSGFEEPQLVYAHPCLQGSPLEIPLQDNSVDLVILPHTLEAHTDPQGILKEVHRILMHDGHIVVIGFNPHHLWNLKKLFRASFSIPIPYQQQLSLHRIRDWFKLLGFEQKMLQEHSLNSPFKFDYWKGKLGPSCFKKDGLIYVIAAQKCTIGMHLIGPALSTTQKNKANHAAVATQQLHKQ